MGEQLDRTHAFNRLSNVKNCILTSNGSIVSHEKMNAVGGREWRMEAGVTLDSGRRSCSGISAHIRLAIVSDCIRLSGIIMTTMRLQSC